MKKLKSRKAEKLKPDQMSAFQHFRISAF